MSFTPTPPSSLPNLGLQASSDAQLEQEARVWFSALWDAMDTEESLVPAPIPTMDTLQLWLQDKPGPSQFPQVLPMPVFMGTPISQPTPTPTMDTLAGGADIPPVYCNFPQGKKLARKGMLTEAIDLSMFNILNVFWHHWFLWVEHLRAQALLAQKADDGKFFWVKFTL
jgi:hypothetical protein